MRFSEKASAILQNGIGDFWKRDRRFFGLSVSYCSTGNTHYEFINHYNLFLSDNQNFVSRRSHETCSPPEGAKGNLTKWQVASPLLSATPPTRMSVGCDERNFSSSEECSLLLNSAGWQLRAFCDAASVRLPLAPSGGEHVS